MYWTHFTVQQIRTCDQTIFQKMEFFPPTYRGSRDQNSKKLEIRKEGIDQRL